MVDLAADEIVADRYRIRDTLGRGAYGAVYLATRLDGDAPLALKIMHERLGEDGTSQQRFEREAEMVRGLRHPNVVQLLDYGRTTDDLPFIAFELLTGRTLRERLAFEGPMDPVAGVRVVRQVLSALGEAHAVGIVHRDIKPENIFLCASPPALVKVLDFGIAKVSEIDTRTALTETGQMLGTPRYMPPEQVRGGLVDARSDLYAVGAVLAEVLTGEKLARGESQIDILMAHLSEAPLDLPAGLQGTPLGDVVKTAVAKDPAQRFGSARVMSSALQEAVTQLPRGTPTLAIASAPAALAVATSTSVLPTTSPTVATFVQPSATHPVTVPFVLPPHASRAPPETARRGKNLIPMLAALGALVLLVGVGVGLWLGGGARNEATRASTSKRRAQAKSKRKGKRTSRSSEKSKVVDVDHATVRKHLIAKGFVIEGDKQGGDDETLSMSTFSVRRGETGGGSVLVIAATGDWLRRSYEDDVLGPNTARVIKKNTVILVTLVNSDPQALADSIAKLIR